MNPHIFNDIIVNLLVVFQFYPKFSLEKVTLDKTPTEEREWSPICATNWNATMDNFFTKVISNFPVFVIFSVKMILRTDGTVTQSVVRTEFRINSCKRKSDLHLPNIILGIRWKIRGRIYYSYQ